MRSRDEEYLMLDKAFRIPTNIVDGGDLRKRLCNGKIIDFSCAHDIIYDRFFIERSVVQYNHIFRVMMNEDWFIFMNHGYKPSNLDGKEYQELGGVFKNWKNQTYLYHYLINKYLQLSGGKCNRYSIIDIGSGRGGGIAALSRDFGFGRAVGVDVNEHHVLFSKRVHTGDVEFVTASAANIPFENDEFDVAVNVESCHCYASVSKFLDEAYRILKRGGHLLLTDVRYRGAGELLLDYEVMNSKFSILFKGDITENVLSACIEDADTFTNSHFGSDLAGFVRRKAKTKAAAYAAGNQCYLSYVLCKE